MAKWTRTLSKPELIEAVTDYLVKKGEIDSKDILVVMSGPLQVSVTDSEPAQSKR